jgi:hypothetical protein
VRSAATDLARRLRVVEHENSVKEATLFAYVAELGGTVAGEATNRANFPERIRVLCRAEEENNACLLTGPCWPTPLPSR